MFDQDFLARMKDRLVEEQERIQDELKDLPVHTKMDDEEEGNEKAFEVDDVNADIGEQLREDLTLIQGALDRVEAGTYGVCSVGGEAISTARLEVIPWATTCTDHEGK
jgi:RNA polymerase-binding transcription factor DksA